MRGASASSAADAASRGAVAPRLFFFSFSFFFFFAPFLPDARPPRRRGLPAAAPADGAGWGVRARVAAGQRHSVTRTHDVAGGRRGRGRPGRSVGGAGVSGGGVGSGNASRRAASARVDRCTHCTRRAGRERVASKGNQGWSPPLGMATGYERARARRAMDGPSVGCARTRNVRRCKNDKRAIRRTEDERAPQKSRVPPQSKDARNARGQQATPRRAPRPAAARRAPQPRAGPPPTPRPRRPPDAPPRHRGGAAAGPVGAAARRAAPITTPFIDDFLRSASVGV